MKWTMIDTKHFIGTEGNFTATVRLGGTAPIWVIHKDGVQVDTCFSYNPTKDELTAKVQVERVLNSFTKS
jgi:hypothetical protein